MTDLPEETTTIMQHYLDNDLTLIPIYPQTKKPCVYWDVYQKFKPSKPEMTEWFRTFWNPQTWKDNNYWKAKWIKQRREALLEQGLTPDEINNNPTLLEYDGSISLAIIAGKNSGNLAIIDDDVNGLTTEELEFYKQKTLVVKTKSGYHIYLKMFNPPKPTRAGDNGEIRGEGAYVVAPPSIHVLGDQYSVVSTTTTVFQLTSDEKEKELLTWAKEKIGAKKKKTKKIVLGTAKNPVKTVTHGLDEWVKNFIEKGFIDDHVNAIALKLFGPAVTQAKIPLGQAVKMILEWATNCHNLKNAPLTVDEEKIKRMIESAAEKGITPLTKEGLNYEYPDLYQQLIDQGIIIKSEYPSYEDFCDEGPHGILFFKPARVAQWLKENRNFKTDYNSEILYYYDGELWIPRAEIYLQELVGKILDEENRKSHYSNIEHHLRSITFENVIFSNKIAVQNGVLDVENVTLSEFNPQEMPFYRIPIKYNPNPEPSKLENWLTFLNQVVEKEDIPLLQEWFGYCLLPDYRFHKALWIHGEGRNGKGVFDRTIKGTIGSNNVSTVGLEELDGTQRFALKDLYGKLYNSTSEPTTNKVFRTEIFQKITGDDLIHAEYKNANKEIEFVNCAKVTIIGNKFPRIHNPTIAFKNRMLFVKFPHYFGDKERTPNLERKWLEDPEQKSAILKWALDGLQRLLIQGFFTQSKTQKDTEIEFTRVTHPPSAFILEKAVFDKNVETMRSTALTYYQNYCEEIGVNADARYLTDALNKLAPKVRAGWTKIKGKNERVWKGIAFKKGDGDDLPQIPQLPQHNLLTIISSPKNNKKIENGVASVANPLSEVKNRRYCSVECKNFDKPSCFSDHWADFTVKTTLPCNCPGFKCKGDVD